MNWTLEQNEAITKEGTNIIVSAGAGSGKTAVLSERVLRKVKEGVDIRNILILTFTNEAAGEMKNRIRKKIKKANLLEQLEYIDVASITTFDAYALGIVKKYHYLLNISKNISIIDSSIIDLERKHLLDKIFDFYYDNKDADFLKLVGDFTTRDDEVIKEAILNINRNLDLKYDKKEFLESYIDNFYNEEHIASLLQEYFLYLKNLCSELEDSIYALGEIVDEKLYTKVMEAYSGYFKPKKYNDIAKVKDIPRVQFRGVPEEGEALKNEIKDIASEIKELSLYTEEELKEQLLSTKCYVKVIIDIILKLEEKVQEYKHEKNAFEFVDIAHMAIKIVSDNEDIRNELKESYNEILIDEYQDTNDLQEIFISKIENNNVYMVGDIKQSIYRFRNANPNIFKNKYDNYKNHINGEKIDLLKNFRSRKEVLDNINLIFGYLMNENYGGVTYKNDHEMIYGNLAYINEGVTNHSNDMEIFKYEVQDGYSNSEIEAFTIAQDISKKVSSKYQVYDFDLKKTRNIEYSDFCIILDRGTDMPLYKKIFEYFNIPMDVYKDSDLVKENDLLVIKNIINLIIAIKNKDFDTNMRYCFVSVARSFVGNLSDSEILNYIDKNTFYDSDIYKKCFNVAKDIDNKTIGSVLEEIIDDFDFYKNLIKVGSVEAGIKRLYYMLDLANMAESLGFTILDFRDYLEEIIDFKKEIRFKEEKGLGNCVKIMNIHKSKGLEFPICYFAGFKKDFNLRDLQSRFLFDNKYGILTPYFNEGIGVTILKTLIKNNNIKEEISEKIRLFYVALTRAKEKIIMVVPDFKNPLTQKEEVSINVASKYRSFYDFISSIAGNLANYTKNVDSKELNLTKDYEVNSKVNNLKINNEKQKIDFYNLEIDFKEIENKHASKTIKRVLTKSEALTLDYGTKMHEKLELTDFKIKSNDKHVEALKNKFDFETANIYQELEFYFTQETIEYHGIIDLMLEYQDEIKIIDYKLKNIDDEAYTKQLNVYYDYISSVSNKPVKLYLYSILDNEVKEISLVNI